MNDCVGVAVCEQCSRSRGLELWVFNFGLTLKPIGAIGSKPFVQLFLNAFEGVLRLKFLSVGFGCWVAA